MILSELSSDFLVSQCLHDHTDLSQLWVDEKEIHRMFATRCIELTLNTKDLGFKHDKYCLKLPKVL